MSKTEKTITLKKWKNDLYIIIFEADTFWGKVFDITLLISILLSVAVVMLESVAYLKLTYGKIFNILEWSFTILFTLEYIARLIVIKKPAKYIFSFFGIVDLLSIIPTYLSLFVVGFHSLLVIRSLRLLRVFRIFKLVRFLGEASQLNKALKASRAKIIVFIGVVSISVAILGTLMYLIEGGENGFTSIPRSIYWAIVTLTTVGYGDIAPHTVLGQTIASLVMILGYGIIAVPTGIVTSEMAKQNNKPNTKACSSCSREGHDNDAEFCKYCGESI
ncbi:MAG: ion transporter [Cyclobacteriaceae bacterium]|nr:ion transporter [Cyclobacteriaceae bacterium]